MPPSIRPRPVSRNIQGTLSKIPPSTSPPRALFMRFKNMPEKMCSAPMIMHTMSVAMGSSSGTNSSAGYSDSPK